MGHRRKLSSSGRSSAQQRRRNITTRFSGHHWDRLCYRFSQNNDSKRDSSMTDSWPAAKKILRQWSPSAIGGRPGIPWF